MRYLLDTNMLSDVMRNPNGRVANRVRKVGDANVCTSIIVAGGGPLRNGQTEFSTARTAIGIGSWADRDIGVLTPADTIYAALRSELERQGGPSEATISLSPLMP